MDTLQFLPEAAMCGGRDVCRSGERGAFFDVCRPTLCPLRCDGAGEKHSFCVNQCAGGAGATWESFYEALARG